MKTYNLADFTIPNKEMQHPTQLIRYAIYEMFKGGFKPIKFEYIPELDDVLPLFTTQMIDKLEVSYKIAVSPMVALFFAHNMQITNVRSHVPIGDGTLIFPQVPIYQFQVKFNIINPESNSLDIKYYDISINETDVSVRFFQTIKDKEEK